MHHTDIPLWSYAAEYARLQPELDAALHGVLQSGSLILGPQVRQFEQDFAARCGASFGVGVHSGTDAIFLALNALGIGQGDEVITVSNTSVATVAAIRMAGATPVFVDIDADTYLMNTKQVALTITTHTKAILPVHLYGQSVDMDPLLELAAEHGLSVIEDCAQSHGARYKNRMTGSMGSIGAFSFYPTKILGAFGDAGLCMTSDPLLRDALMQLRMYGMQGTEYYSEREGFNSRLDELQAAVLNVKLLHMDDAIAKRQAIATRYDEGLRDSLKIPSQSPHSTHSYYLYVVAHPKRTQIQEALLQRGIGTKVHFPHPVHLMKGYDALGYQAGDLPVTEKAASEIFSLPMYPDLPMESVDRVIDALREILQSV